MSFGASKNITWYNSLNIKDMKPTIKQTLNRSLCTFYNNVKCKTSPTTGAFIGKFISQTH